MKKSNWDRGESEQQLKHEVALGYGEGYDDMLKQRKEKLPEIRETLDNVLKDYKGEAITIVIMQEDKSGLPTGHQLFIAGVSRPEVQIDMGKALHNASRRTLEVLLEAVKHDPQALEALSEMLTNALKGRK